MLLRLHIEKQNARRREHFFSRLYSSPKRALLLDYDGTIAPFCANRNRAVPDPLVRQLLSEIHISDNTRVVIITGRPAHDLLPLLDMDGLEIWGCHGLERLRPDGTHEVAAVGIETLEQISKANELLMQHGLSRFLEFKRAATAIHWRGMETAAKEVAQSVEKVWSELASHEGLEMLPFDGGLEIRATTRNKGDVVRAIIHDSGWGASIAYLGDDQTDEDAFAALQGFGLSVLVRNEYRPTLADIWVRPPRELVGFLEEWTTACRGER